tara:strand:- start:63 stop:1232 length:1170 start_codon:yes stop_codon:yes gene_type:complete
MAKKLPWGSFSHEDLRVDHEDDIYSSFAFLKLKVMTMVELSELRISDNAVRGIKDTVSQKLVGLSGSLFYGWDRTSWPVPFMIVNGELIVFDRRHTVKVCRNITNQSVQKISSLPGAEYVRHYPKNGGIINDFSDRSILILAAMYGNVHGPIADDTRDYMFETACIQIISNEENRHGEEVSSKITTRQFVRDLLKHMGCFTRYNNNDMVINRIVTKVLDSFKDPQTQKGKLTINNNPSDLDDFITRSEDWGHSNTSNDTTVFSVLRIHDNDAHNRTYAERLLHTACKLEANLPEGQNPKLYKIMLYNEKNSKDASKITAARRSFVKSLNEIWYIRRDNVLAPVKKMFNFEIPSKKLNDFNMEIWCMNQIEDEDEPYELLFDTESGQERG